MRKSIIGLFLGLFLLTSSLSAQKSKENEVELPFPARDNTEVVSTIKVEFENPKASELNVRYKNVLESLTEEQINQVINSIEERSKASADALLTLEEVLLSLKDILEDKEYMQNKVIYQAQKHYGISEQRVKNSLGRKHVIDLVTYSLMLLLAIFTGRRMRKDDVASDGFIDLQKVAAIILTLSMNLFIVWFILRNIVLLAFNQNFEIINFLLKGS